MTFFVSLSESATASVVVYATNAHTAAIIPQLRDIIKPVRGEYSSACFLVVFWFFLLYFVFYSYCLFVVDLFCVLCGELSGVIVNFACDEALVCGV